VTWLWRELAPYAFTVARLAPVAFLCPLLGGSIAPPTVRLGVALVLAGFAVRVSPAVATPESVPGFVGALLVECLLGLGLGLAASAPFDAARVGGRLMDLARGSSAEAALPHAGSRETASGDLLYQLLVALAAAGIVLPNLVATLCRSFAAVPPGTAAISMLDPEAAIRVTGSVLATGLAIAAPVIAVCLLIDATLALAARIGPSFALQEQMTGLRLTAGAVAFWFGLGGVASALLERAAGGQL
jgi:flagellar biosynthesis protein FliR